MRVKTKILTGDYGLLKIGRLDWDTERMNRESCKAFKFFLASFVEKMTGGKYLLLSLACKSLKR